jgi:hypothetical protein
MKRAHSKQHPRFVFPADEIGEEQQHTHQQLIYALNKAFFYLWLET